MKCSFKWPIIVKFYDCKSIVSAHFVKLKSPHTEDPANLTAMSSLSETNILNSIYYLNLCEKEDEIICHYMRQYFEIKVS